jgi:hypothetical protein
MARRSLGDLTELVRGRSDGHPRSSDRPELRRGVAAAAGPADCGNIDIRIARDGTWFYHGSPIGRKPLVRLFASALRRNSDGSYWLVTPSERVRIRVDDAPFVAVAMTVEGEGRKARLRFVTNVDDTVNAGRDHPIRVAFDPATGEPAPYVMVRDGLEALISRSVYYELVAIGESRGATYGVWSDGAFFALGEAPCAS